MKKSNLVRTIILAGSLLLQLNTLCFQSHGAAGDVDLSFDPGSGVDGGVVALAVQPDGKVIIGGDFTTVKGLVRTGIARLNADGSGDNSFNPPWVARSAISILLQADGKVLVGNDLGIQRLNSDGSLDDTFSTTVTQIDDYLSVDSIAIQSDGKVLIGGYFTIINGTNRNGIARLHADGTLDTSFNPGTGPNGSVQSIVVQPDGRILIGGSFTTVNGTNRNYIARLDANGSLDSSFNPGTGPNSWISSVALQPDGGVVLGGVFTAVNGTNRTGIARLNANGTLDNSFNPGTVLTIFAPQVLVYSLAVQVDGKVVVGGAFAVNGTNSSNVARFNPDGTLDAGFDPGPGADYTVHSVAVQPDGRVLIGGSFNAVQGTVRKYMARLNAEGSLDANFNPGKAIEYPVASVFAQPDGKVLIDIGIARLNANGSLDTTFNPGMAVSAGVLATALQADGQVLVGGSFFMVNGTNWDGVVRLNVNGSLDASFQSDSFISNSGLANVDYAVPESLAVQADGKVLVGGWTARIVAIDVFNDNYYYAFGYFVSRVNADGSRDTSFSPTVGGYYYAWGGSIPWHARDVWTPTVRIPTVQALTVQPDGKVLIGGFFNSINGTNSNAIARLNTDGTLDSGFNIGSGLNFDPAIVHSVALQPDGKILIAGKFTSVNGTNRNYVARLNANGSLDSSFNPGTGANNWIESLALQPDGKVLIGGYFTTINGTNRNAIARLNADGSLDSSFNPGTGAEGYVRSIALQSDGNVLIGGNFTTVNGVLRPHVARLYGDSAPSLNIARSNASVIVSWPFPSTGFELQQNTDLNPANWTTPPETVSDNGTTRFITVSPAPGNRLYRLFKP